MRSRTQAEILQESEKDFRRDTALRIADEVSISRCLRNHSWLIASASGQFESRKKNDSSNPKMGGKNDSDTLLAVAEWSENVAEKNGVI